jgi:hypothetical protein
MSYARLWFSASKSAPNLKASNLYPPSKNPLEVRIPEVMESRYFAIVQALARHALYAAADLPQDHPQRRIIRHQVERLIKEFAEAGDANREGKLKSLAQWFDDGAVPGDAAILSGYPQA